jgi:hypothetical protein
MAIDRHEFKAWLDTQNPNAVVGKIDKMDACPLANFLVVIKGFDRAYVGDNGNCQVQHDGEALQNLQMPSWATAFVLAVDAGDSEAITALEAINIVNDIEGLHPNQE